MLDIAAFKGYQKIIGLGSCKSGNGWGFKLSFGMANRGMLAIFVALSLPHLALHCAIHSSFVNAFHGKVSGRTTSTRPFMRVA